MRFERFTKATTVATLLALTACGGGGGDDAASSGGGSGGGPSALVDLGLSPLANADAGSSYANAAPDIRISYYFLPRPDGVGNLRDAVAYLDADGDGDTDVFMATGEYLLQGETGSFLTFNTGADIFAWQPASPQAFGGTLPPATHARKSITADFNGDGRADLFVFDHGYDANPFPGAAPKLILQAAPGTFSWTRLPDVGFHHGGAAADIDHDGDIDVFVGGFAPFFYVNDGAAGFTRATNRFDGSMAKVFTAELIDVDQDGFVDLLLGAHERDGDRTAIYWGSSTGAYSAARRTLIPAAAPYGAVLDFDAEDLDGDGDRDLVLNRTRDGDDGPGLGFYMGRTVQVLLNTGNRQFSDVTATHVDKPTGEPGFGGTDWFPWLRVQDIDADGDLDLFPDNLASGTSAEATGMLYRNDGSGRFTLQWVDVGLR